MAHLFPVDVEVKALVLRPRGRHVVPALLQHVQGLRAPLAPVGHLEDDVKAALGVEEGDAVAAGAVAAVGEVDPALVTRPAELQPHAHVVACQGENENKV